MFFLIKGALYGGAISLVAVVYIGIMALIHNGEAESLPLSLESCNCFVGNETSSQEGTIDFYKDSDQFNSQEER